MFKINYKIEQVFANNITSFSKCFTILYFDSLLSMFNTYNDIKLILLILTHKRILFYIHRKKVRCLSQQYHNFKSINVLLVMFILIILYPYCVHINIYCRNIENKIFTHNPSTSKLYVEQFKI